MKTFKNIAEWLKTNPSEEEQRKVIILINKGAVSNTRREIYEKTSYLRKLQSLVNHFKRIGLEPPKSEIDAIEKVKKEIEVLTKSLPAPVKRAKEKAIVE